MTRTENIFALQAGSYSVAEGSDYFPATAGNFGVLLVIPAEYNYVTALYIDSGANIFFGFAVLGGGVLNWTALPHQ